AAKADPFPAWIAVASVLVFSLLDASYLARERAYRSLYDHMRTQTTLDWTLTAPEIGLMDLRAALFSWSVLPLYATLMIGAAWVATLISLA
ncbi:MAG: hypothetical protein ACLGIA_00495, partial [Actinomycetes bacterium]